MFLPFEPVKSYLQVIASSNQIILIIQTEIIFGSLFRTMRHNQFTCFKAIILFQFLLLNNWLNNPTRTHEYSVYDVYYFCCCYYYYFFSSNRRVLMLFLQNAFPALMYIFAVCISSLYFGPRLSDNWGDFAKTLLFVLFFFVSKVYTI